MKGDWVPHYFGWHYFRHEPWHWPPGAVHGYYAPLGTSIGLTDSIPLVGYALKPFAAWLPTPFQYLGPFLLASFALQGALGARLVAHYADETAAALAGRAGPGRLHLRQIGTDVAVAGGRLDACGSSRDAHTEIAFACAHVPFSRDRIAIERHVARTALDVQVGQCHLVEGAVAAAGVHLQEWSLRVAYGHIAGAGSDCVSAAAVRRGRRLPVVHRHVTGPCSHLQAAHHFADRHVAFAGVH